MDRWLDRFISIGRDNLVVVYDTGTVPPSVVGRYGRHSSTVEQIRWIPAQDYLCVKCADETLTLWELVSCTMEQIITGKLAAEIFDHAASLSESARDYQLKVINKQALTSLVVPLGSFGVRPPPPLQALLVNVKALAGELYQALAHNPPPAGDDSDSERILHDPLPPEYEAIHILPRLTGAERCRRSRKKRGRTLRSATCCRGK